MKKVFFILISAIGWTFSFSQEIVVGNTEMDILFVGYQNKLVISVPETELSAIKVEGENCKISAVDKTGAFTVNPSGGSPLTLTFSVNDVVIGSKKYRVKGFPIPHLYLGNYEPESTISKKNLSNTLSMKYHSDATFPIQFSLPVITKWGVSTEKGEAIGTGSTLSVEALALLRSATENQKITIYADVLGEDKITRKTASSFVISE